MIAADLVTHDPAGLKGHDPLPQRGHDLGVVGGHQHGRAHLVDSQQQLDDLPADRAGRRLPVGSSAMTSWGPWTIARAMAARCISPPDSWPGRWSAWPVRPAGPEQPVHRGPDLLAWRAGHLQRERHVLAHGLAGQQPEVLEHDPDLASENGVPRPA